MFEWIHSTLDRLQMNGTTHEPFEKLKTAIEACIPELVALNVDQTIKVVDRWFEEHQERIILQLNSHPETQFGYLQKLIESNEKHIQNLINEAQIAGTNPTECKQWLDFLVLYVKLLCKFDRKNVQEYVSKEFYPVERCLDICKQEGV